MIYVLLKGGKRRKDGEVWTTPKGRRMTKKNGKVIPVASGRKRTKKNSAKSKKPEAKPVEIKKRVEEHRYVSTKVHADAKKVHDIASNFASKDRPYTKTGFHAQNMVSHDEHGVTATDGAMLMHIPHAVPEESRGLKYPKWWKDEKDDQYHTSDMRFPPVAKVIPMLRDMNGRNFESVKDLYNGAEMAYRDWKHAPKAERTKNPIFRLVTTGNTTIAVDARRVMKIASAFQKLGHRELHLQAYRDSDTGSQRPVVFGPTRTVVDDNPLGKVPFALLMPILEKRN